MLSDAIECIDQNMLIFAIKFFFMAKLSIHNIERDNLLSPVQKRKILEKTLQQQYNLPWPLQSFVTQSPFAW